MSVRNPFGTGSRTWHDALNSQRSMNIQMPAAIAELIDNSFEHGGTNVHVQIDMLSEVGNDHVPERAIVVDDGNGMNPEKLADHLTIGFHEEDEDSPMRFGKFGVGAKYAFFNNCTKSEVWSKTKEGIWHKAEFDLNDEDLKQPIEKIYIQIAQKAAEKGRKLTEEECMEFLSNLGIGYPSRSIQQDPPSEFQNLWGHLEHGTFVMWTNFDRGELAFGHEELEWYFSRVYRKWIGDHYVGCGTGPDDEPATVLIDNPNKTKLYYNGSLLKAYDPLYRIPFREGDVIPEESQANYPPIIFEYPLSPAAREKYGIRKSMVMINFGLSPPDWRTERGKSAESEINLVERRIQGASTKRTGDNRPFWDSQVVSMVRSGREVACIWDHNLTGVGRVLAIDRWWGMEIEFDETLDDAFNVQNVKSRTGPKSDLRRVIKNKVSGTIQQMRNEIQDHFEKCEHERQVENRRRQREECEARGGRFVNGRCVIPGEDPEPGDQPTPTVPENPIDPSMVPVITDDPEEEYQRWVREIFGDSPLVQRIIDGFESDTRVVHEEDNLDKRVPQDTSMMFEYSVRGGRLLKVRYANHPYHKTLKENYEKLEGTFVQMQAEIDDGEMNKDKMIGYINDLSNVFAETQIIHDHSINSALLGMAQAQGGDMDRIRLMRNVVAQWSNINLQLVDQLIRDRENSD